jgi:hypothetical protein
MSEELLAQLVAHLREARELLEDYVDADHNGICYIPNAAMQADALLAEAISLAEKLK